MKGVILKIVGFKAIFYFFYSSFLFYPYLIIYLFIHFSILFIYSFFYFIYLFIYFVIHKR